MAHDPGAKGKEKPAFEGSATFSSCQNDDWKCEGTKVEVLQGMITVKLLWGKGQHRREVGKAAVFNRVLIFPLLINHRNTPAEATSHIKWTCNLPRVAAGAWQGQSPRLLWYVQAGSPSRVPDTGAASPEPGWKDKQFY